MERIYVNEDCVLSVIEKEGKFIVKMSDKDIFESDDREIAIRLMTDIANTKRKDQGAEEYKPKNNIEGSLSVSTLESTLLMPSKLEKNMDKYNSLKNRIKDKKLLSNIPDDIKLAIEEFKITQADLLVSLEECKKNDIEFYDYMRLTIEGLKEKKGKENLNKKINDGEIDAPSKTFSSARKASKGKKQKKIDSRELLESEVHYIANTDDHKVSYIVAVDNDKKSVMVLKEVEVNKAFNVVKEDVFDFFIMLEQDYKTEEERDELIEKFKDEADELASAKTKEEDSKPSSSIGSIEDYFNKIDDKVDSIFGNIAKEMMESIADNVEVETVKNIKDIDGDGDIDWDSMDSIEVYLGMDEIAVQLYSNQKIEIKETNKMKFVDDTIKEIDFKYSKRGEVVKLGYSCYLDGKMKYYVAFIQNQGAERQLMFGTYSIQMIDQFISDVTDIIDQLNNL